MSPNNCGRNCDQGRRCTCVTPEQIAEARRVEDEHSIKQLALALAFGLTALAGAIGLVLFGAQP